MHSLVEQGACFYYYLCVCACVCAVPPEMSRSHDEYTVIVDNPILMSCEVTGIPAPQVTWTAHGEDIADVKNSSAFHVLANGALRIDHVTTDDSGMYECVATNVAGNATMAVTLNVQGTHRLTISRAILSCDALALLVGHWTCDLQVAGSSPGWAPLRSALAQATYTCVPLSPSSIG